MRNLVLVAVVNRKKDLQIALNHNWYRIPSGYAPKKKADFLALYQTRVFNETAKSINYYAPIKKYSLIYRQGLLPEEKGHPRANQLYQKIKLGRIRKTPRRIKNKNSIRVNFGFTTLEKLLNSRELGQLFNVPPLERVMSRELQKNGIKNTRQYCIMKNKKCRYRLDFAVFCKKGKIDIECDNIKWHYQPAKRKQDRRRNYWLKKHNWQVLRFSDNELINNIDYCIRKINQSVHSLGGLSP